MRLHQRPAGDEPELDAGFTLVELLVVMVILGGCLLGLLVVQTSALRSVTLAKERQQATALTTRTMEQFRALPYDTVTAGLRTTDLTGDANITSGRLRPVGYPNSIDEQLVTGVSAAQAPLFPHCQQGAATLVRNVQYRVCSYVTLVSATAGDTTKGYWLTVITTWSSGASQATTKTVSTRSQLFSPTGCLGTATRPFSGPCQAFHDGTATTQPGSLEVTGTVAGSPVVAGNPLTSGRVMLPAVTASVQSQQVVSVQATAQTSGAGMANGTSPEPVTGQQTASTGAFTDPDAASGAVPTSAPVTQSSSPLSQAGGGATVTMTPGANDSGASVSTTRAIAASQCLDVAGNAVTSGEACASSRLTPPTGPQSLALNYGQDIPLGSVAAPSPSVTSRAFVSRYLSPGGAYCATTSVSGCIAAATSRTLGTAVLGGLPTGATKPAAFTGAMVTVSDYSDSAWSAAGIGAEAPTASRGGTLSYWNGTGYSPVTLTPTLNAGYNLGTLTASYSDAGGPITVTMTGSVTVGAGGAAAPTGPATCQPEPCVRSSSSGTLSASVDYVLTRDTTELARFTTTLNPGASSARTTYRAPLES